MCHVSVLGTYKQQEFPLPPLCQRRNHFAQRHINLTFQSAIMLQVGAVTRRNCTKCHQSLEATFSAPSIQAARPAVPRCGADAGDANRARSKQSAAGKRTARTAALQAAVERLQPGQALPHGGACRHYKHSHRWLRFPCCGLRFPCDLCHEELTDGHEMAWAKRMVCGFCSVEQALAAKCSACGKKLAATAARPEGRNTRHWEGGRGCRDKRMLDARDKHKYKNSGAKTVSRRAARRGGA